MDLKKDKELALSAFRQYLDLDTQQTFMEVSDSLCKDYDKTMMTLSGSR